MNDKEVKIRIVNVLHDVAIPSHIIGYQCLIEALDLAMKDPAMVQNITRKLYPAVAARMGSTPSRVERAMRHAIEVAFDRAEPDVTYKYFGNSVSGNKGKPTNAEFIATMAEWILLERDL